MMMMMMMIRSVGAVLIVVGFGSIMETDCWFHSGGSNLQVLRPV
jgi:hypothetical protein